MTKQTVYTKVLSVQALLWAALVLALVGSLRHVAWGFSTLEQGDLIAGYVQAVAVDLGLFALALGIQNRKRQGRATRGLWVGVMLFSGVSTYANLLHGLHFQDDLGLQGWSWLVSMRPFILSAVLPCLVVYLSEIAGDDVNYSVKLAEREAKRQEREAAKAVQVEQAPVSSTAVIDAKPDTLAQARQVKAEQDSQDKAANLDRLLTLCADNTDVSVTELSKQLGTSRTTVYTYIKELGEQGKLSKNGQGWEVVNLDSAPIAQLDSEPVAN